MKKTYIKPCVNVMKLQGDIMVQTVSGDGLEGVNQGSKDSPGSLEADSKAFFGWGDEED